MRSLLVCGLILLCPALGFGQHYPMLPVPNSPHGIFAMMEDSKSRLWLGTADDVYCFDGVNFYSLRPYGFPHEIPNAFSEDSEGRIWIGTQGTDASGGTRAGGLYRYQFGRVDKVLSGDVLGVVSIAPGVLLAAMGTEVAEKPAYGDLYRIGKIDNHWAGERLMQNIADHISVDHHGNALFPCPGGWCEVAAEQVVNWKAGNAGQAVRRHAGDPQAERVLRDSQGCVWMRAEARGSYQCPGDAQATHLPYEYSQFDSSAHLEEGADGSILMLVPMVLGRPGHFHTLGSNGLPPSVDSAILGHDGTIWIGTDNGLIRFPHPFQLEHWAVADGLAGGQSFVYTIGDRIFSTASDLVTLSPDRQRWIPTPGTSRFGQIYDMLTLPDGHILLASAKGVALYEAGSGRVLASVATDLWLRRSHFAQTRDGTIWLAEQSLSHVSIHGHAISLTPESIPQNGVSDMRYDRARDILWVCDGRQLMFRKDGYWHAVSQKDGLLEQRCDQLNVAPDGNLWLAYQAKAYAYIAEPASGHPRIFNYTENLDNAQALFVGFLLSDTNNRVWRRSNVLNVATSEQARQGNWLSLGTQDGFGAIPSDELSIGNAGDDGSIWFGSDGRILHFSPPDDFVTRFPVPRISITGLAAGTEAFQLADAVQGPPRNQEITAQVGTVQFDRRNALHLRYRLLPRQSSRQSSWISTSDFVLHLGRPSWGSHTLEVQAQLSAGPWSNVVEQSFTVIKPVWLTWPALAGFAIAGGALAAAGRRWRWKRRERAKKAFPVLAEWRMAALSPELGQLDGTLLNSRFEVGRILARGGFATVTEGRDVQQDGRPCAIKIFRQELVDKEWMTRRFQQEVLALEQIHHPNVVSILGSGTLPSGALYLVMEFIDGVTLRELLEPGKLAPVRIASYLRQAGSALDQIHHCGICHRDLKPENLMIRSAAAPGQELVLIDFSIAIVKDPDETLHGLSRAAGTIYYMAPEQAIGYADASTDIYSLAKIVIEMLTGQRLSLLLPDASMDLPDRVRELLGSLPVRLSSSAIELLSSALEFDPSRRPKDAGSFAERIAADLDFEAELSGVAGTDAPDLV